jgi:hypothetical protein
MKAEVDRVVSAKSRAGENGVAHRENGVHPAPDAVASS